MISKEKLAAHIEDYLGKNSLFLVGIEISRDNDIEVTVDSMGIVELNHCIGINNLIEEGFDRETEDYSLTVTSAGLDQPLKVFRQYEKWMGKEVEIVLKSGGKLKGVLTAAEQESISLSHEKSEKVEGKKKKEKISVKENFLLKDIKSTKPIIHFK